MGMPQTIFGACNGTGAAIHVCLGFVPRSVRIFNVEDAGSLQPEAIWANEMALFTAIAGGIKTVGGSDATIERTLMTTGGISAYAGGDLIVYDGVTNNRWNKSDLSTDASQVYVDGEYEKAVASDADYKCIGDTLAGVKPYDGQKIVTPAGFSIGTDGDLNVSGEQLLWIVTR